MLFELNFFFVIVVSLKTYWVITDCCLVIALTKCSEWSFVFTKKLKKGIAKHRITKFLQAFVCKIKSEIRQKVAKFQYEKCFKISQFKISNTSSHQKVFRGKVNGNAVYVNIGIAHILSRDWGQWLSNKIEPYHIHLIILIENDYRVNPVNHGSETPKGRLGAWERHAGITRTSILWGSDCAKFYLFFFFLSCIPSFKTGQQCITQYKFSPTLLSNDQKYQINFKITQAEIPRYFNTDKEFL